MRDVQLVQNYNLSSEYVWEKWRRFNDIHKFSAMISESKIISKIKFGIGTKRLCKLESGGEIYEEIVDFSDNDKSLTFSMTTEIMLFKAAYLSLEVYSVSENKSKIVMTLSFLPKFSYVGELMVRYIILPKVKSVFEDLLINSKQYFENDVESTANIMTLLNSNKDNKLVPL